MPRPDRLPTEFDIPVDKLTQFLLNPNGRKPERAAFFLRLGFDQSRPEELAEALYRHAASNHHVGFVPNAYGHSVIYEGSLLAPIGPARDVRSVWQVDGTGPASRARFVTAYRYRRSSKPDRDGEAIV